MLTITEATRAPVSTGPGKIRIRLIDAGKGASATYPADVLEAAAVEKAFPAGTEIHFDHQTAEERAARPEGSVKDLVGVTIEDAVYDPETQALEADAKVYSPYRTIVSEMADDVGMSIRAWIDAADSPDGPVATRILEGISVDVVTKAGRGGKILAVLESARRMSEASSQDRRDQLRRALAAAFVDTDGHPLMWLRDFDDEARTFWYEDRRDRTWQDGYTPADDGLSVTLTGAPVEVRPVTTYVPVAQAGQESTTTQEAHMPQIEESRLAELEAAAARVATLETDLAEATERATRAEEAQTAAERSRTIAEALAALDKPAAFKARVAERLRDAEAVTPEAVEAAVTAETEYLADVTTASESDRLTGFGATTTSETRRRKTDAWGDPIKEH